ncbi:hypothetical protein [Paenisporosarcina cavernae]|uniref:Flagellar hook-length control protein-like C-terminal domain-containing protein n=1 Tax=Paenisporosarcina cavernae TaxID=2320858 RepID=A0A385YR36_9BACL|nr:hypothetical protein [Paenisporosarcina cavernae]AYC29225.1 hypothetical protein D3873_04765 [Paenisporosarcina cavernae]
MTSFPSIQPNSQSIPVSEKGLSLKSGQVFHGTITKLFPDQMAEVQVGNQKMMAKLEVPLKAGDAHFFQVTKASPEMQIKVVTSPLQGQQGSSASISQLLDSMQLPKTETMEQLVKFMVKEQIPLSKEQLLQADQWLKALPANVSKTEALQAIQKMIQLKAPFTTEVFQSLISGQSKEGLQPFITQLKQLLPMEPNIPNATKQQLLQNIQNVTVPFQKEVVLTTVGVLLHQVMNEEGSISARAAALQFLKETNLSTQISSISSFTSSTIKQMVANPATVLSMAQEFVQKAPLSVEQRTTMQSLLSVVQAAESSPSMKASALPVLSNEVLKAGTQLMQQGNFQSTEVTSLRDQFVQLLQQVNGEKGSSFPMQALQKALQETNSIVVRKAIVEANLQVESQVNLRAMDQAIKSTLQATGIFYEGLLQTKGDPAPGIVESLKPQLLALLAEHPVSAALKEASEQVVHRLNGLQLHSGENGPQQQILMQIPLDFFGRKMDATLQWNGRTKENGQIDANYARIMFYLDLTSMKETVIDMQIQNRVVTVTIFNEDSPMSGNVQSFQKALKAGLADKDYQLSGVFFKPFTQAPEQANKQKARIEGTTGVDIKI